MTAGALSSPRLLSLLLFTPSALFLVPSLAQAQLRETQVLVVYDSRIPDSRAVAEHYAGSTLVPGGAGGNPGLHPRVHVVDLAALPGAGVVPTPPAIAVPDIDYPTFISALRDPLRVHIASSGLARSIRSIVLTKGIPHRIQNIGIPTDPNQPPTIGDNPGQVNAAFSGGYYGNLTFASVDAELTLLWQSLSDNENGAVADSKADGWILNPYWRAAQPTTTFAGVSITAWPTTLIHQTRTFLKPSQGGLCDTSYDGLQWYNQPVGGACSAPANTNALTPGDIYLVCRLDGNTVADVVAALNRAQNLTIPMNTASALMDKDGVLYSGFQLDNMGPGEINNGADYDQTNAFFFADRRLNTANVRYNNQPGMAQFYVGPHTAYSGYTSIISTPVILLASLGANHNGNTLPAAMTTYGQSFNLLPGAIFNSVESYNGRAFGGLGQNPFAPQQQAADFLADPSLTRIGGTFAVANVWEPLAWTSADNLQIVRHFLLGNLSWAEAAYSSLPVLSWQQIVLGDPLARAKRNREDINADGPVTIDDLYAWYQTPVNLNNLGSADDTDFRLLESTVRANEQTNMKP